MKTAFLVLGVSSACVGAFGNPALPSFSDNQIGLPPVSLLDSAKSAELSRNIVEAKATASWYRDQQSRPDKPLVSRMPVIAPKPDFESKMPVVAPDSSVDFKLIIKTPAVESVK